MGKKIDGDFKQKVSGLNRTAMHRRTGISVSHISRVFNGVRMPSSEKLAEIAADLGVSMEALFDYLKTIRRSNRRGTTNAA